MKRVVYAIAVAVFAANISTACCQEVKLPQKFIEQSEFFVGEWTYQWDIDGNTYRGKWAAKWSPEKSCLISHFSSRGPDGPRSGTRIHGWDAAKEQMMVVNFSPDGSSSIERYTIVAGPVDEGEMTGIDEEGEPIKATLRIVRERDDLFVWTVTTDDQSVVYKFQRVKK
jgi:hypothetical protein